MRADVVDQILQWPTRFICQRSIQPDSKLHQRIRAAASAMPSLGHTFFVHCTLIPCDRSHSLGRRMTVDLPPRPTEWRDAKSPPQRPPVDGGNEFAAFAAQLAARNEKRRAGEASAAPPPGVD